MADTPVGTLVDSNVLLDVLTEDQRWADWSSNAIELAAEAGPLYINPIIYAEVSVRFTRVEDLEEALPPADFRRAHVPWAAAFLAAKAFVAYRRRGGQRTSTLPDFFIGAHAATANVHVARLLHRCPRGDSERLAPQSRCDAVSDILPDCRSDRARALTLCAEDPSPSVAAGTPPLATTVSRCPIPLKPSPRTEAGLIMRGSKSRSTVVTVVKSLASESCAERLARSHE